jgi:hypothetical protein
MVWSKVALHVNVNPTRLLVSAPTTPQDRFFAFLITPGDAAEKPISHNTTLPAQKESIVNA